MRHRLASLALVVAAATLVGACSDDGPNEQRDAIDQASPDVAATVRYSGTGFEPTTVTIEAGQSIVVVNGDGVDRRFRTDPPAFDSGAQPPGEQVTWTFPTAEEYQVTADGTEHHFTVTVQPEPSG